MYNYDNDQAVLLNILNPLILNRLEVGLSPSKKIVLFSSMKALQKVMKNAFYFILKSLFVLKIFKFLSKLFGHVGKTA